MELVQLISCHQFAHQTTLDRFKAARCRSERRQVFDVWRSPAAERSDSCHLLVRQPSFTSESIYRRPPYERVMASTNRIREGIKVFVAGT